MAAHGFSGTTRRLAQMRAVRKRQLRESRLLAMSGCNAHFTQIFTYKFTNPESRVSKMHHRSIVGTCAALPLARFLACHDCRRRRRGFSAIRGVFPRRSKSDSLFSFCVSVFQCARCRRRRLRLPRLSRRFRGRRRRGSQTAKISVIDVAHRARAERQRDRKEGKGN